MRVGLGNEGTAADMPRKTPSLWIVLVGWNCRADVLHCLRALSGQTYPRVRVVLVDNGSTDGTVAAIQAEFPHVGVFPLSRNHGFAYAVNIALRHALNEGADHVLLLNVDTRFGPEFLSGLVAVLQSNKRLGVVSPKILLERRDHRLWGVGGTLTAAGVRFVGLDKSDSGQYDHARLDFVLGCAMLIRGEVLRQVGLLDERFFVFFEEIDFCLRARAAGWQVALAPHIRISHVGGATTRGRPALREFYLSRSRMVFLRKYRAHFSLFRLATSEFRRFGHTVRERVRTGRIGVTFGYLRGTLAGLTGRGATLQSERS